ncbi:MAG TPA: 50S ribosomal protein L9 [Nitrospiria bacterium]|nr:50S ribosomal protein L9 [Nitrospiria bacterium]
MKVILREDVDALGRMGDLVSVSDGYARNFLIPKKKAVEATTKNVKVMEHEKRLISDKARKMKKEFETLAEKINGTPITIPVQVGEEGKLFGSVTNKDIAEALSKEGIEIDKRKIQLESPLKEVGSFTLPVQVYHDVKAHLKLTLIKA